MAGQVCSKQAGGEIECSGMVRVVGKQRPPQPVALISLACVLFAGHPARLWRPPGDRQRRPVGLRAAQDADAPGEGGRGAQCDCCGRGGAPGFAVRLPRQGAPPGAQCDCRGRGAPPGAQCDCRGRGAPGCGLSSAHTPPRPFCSLVPPPPPGTCSPTTHPLTLPPPRPPPPHGRSCAPTRPPPPSSVPRHLP
jgi:hypothetical protein